MIQSTNIFFFIFLVLEVISNLLYMFLLWFSFDRPFSYLKSKRPHKYKSKIGHKNRWVLQAHDHDWLIYDVFSRVSEEKAKVHVATSEKEILNKMILHHISHYFSSIIYDFDSQSITRFHVLKKQENKILQVKKINIPRSQKRQNTSRKIN